MGRGSSVVGAPLRNLDKFVYHTLPVMCLSGEIIKAVGPFNLVSMPAEVKYPHGLDV